MLPEDVTRIVFAVIFFSVFSVGFYYRIQAHRQNDRFERMKHEGATTFLILRVAGGILWLTAFLFPLFPEMFAPVRYTTTATVQMTGILLALIAVPMGVSVFTAIGKNITDTVETRQNHQLVTTGIYRFIRHPLYTTGLLLFVGLGLLAAVWPVLLFSAVVAVTLYVRTFTEENKLIEEFGDAYRRYMKSTGKFFPKLYTTS